MSCEYNAVVGCLKTRACHSSYSFDKSSFVGEAVAASFGEGGADIVGVKNVAGERQFAANNLFI